MNFQLPVGHGLITNKSSLAKNPILIAAIVSVASMVAGGMMLTSAHAENAREIYDQSVLYAELEFADTIQKAKQELKEITFDPNVESEVSQLAQERYDQIVEEAKLLRDQKIEQARETYIQATTISSITLEDARKQFTQAILDAKTEYEAQLEQAEIDYEKALSEITNNDELKELEETYEEIIDEIKQVYNNAIATANQDYQMIRNMISGGSDNA